MIEQLMIGLVASFIAVYCGGITINAPKKFLIPAGIGGSICWSVYLLTLPATNPTLANFIASLAVAFYSQIMARVYKTPVTVFFIPGFLPIVPGIGIYRTVYYYISGNTLQFNHYLSQSISTATIIAIAIILTDASFKTVTRFIKLRNSK